MIFNSIVLFSILSTVAFCLDIKHPHDYLVQKQICEVIAEHDYDKYNSGIKMKCNWIKFRDENDKLVNSAQKFTDSKYIYEIIFTASPVSSDAEHYKIINAGLFSNMRLRSLSFQSLSIVKIEVGAFDSYCCERTLVSIDLSKNHIIRIDAEALKHLRRLERINLHSNFLALTDRNFEYMKNTQYIDLSNNNLQYLPKNLFGGLTELELVNLSDNNLQQIDACTFSDLQTSSLARSLFPAKIELSGNPMACNCDLFYLSRHRAYKVEANCVSPQFYAGKLLSSLVREDPSARCDYKNMQDTCTVPSNTGFIIAVVILSVFTGLFLACCLICCCKYVSASERVESVNRELNHIKFPPKKVDRSMYVDAKVADKQRLIN